MRDIVITCPRCGHRVGLRRGGAIRNHRGRPPEIVCKASEQMLGAAPGRVQSLSDYLDWIEQKRNTA